MLAAFIFLIQRGLAAGITIYAPSIILSTLLGWPLQVTCVLIGLLVIIYTVTGGTEAVTQTQKQQMTVITAGLVVAGILVIRSLPENVGLTDALHVAGKMGKLNVVDFEFDLTDKYNFWSGMTGAIFLFLSYFGTDQSQVQRYLSGKSLTESRLGLIMNGLLKVPLQFVILLIGALVFVYYQYNQPPIFFNEEVRTEMAQDPEYAESFSNLETQYQSVFKDKKESVSALNRAISNGSPAAIERAQVELNQLQENSDQLRLQAKEMIEEALPDRESNDRDYIFMTFVMSTMPIGVVGLLFAVIFSAAMSSTSSELNALGSTSLVDFYKRLINPNASNDHYLKYSKLLTLMWGLIAIIFATSLQLFENLITAVNLIGSLFYPIILGIFMVAIFFKSIKSNAVFISAILSQAIVIGVHYLNTIGQAGLLTMGYLWYNAFGCILVILLSFVMKVFLKES
jgi:Na+/proline symporter